MGYRGYLCDNNVWWRSRLHDGRVEGRVALVVMNGHEVLEQVDQLKFPINKHSTLKEKKRKRALNWSKRSIFFELPY